MLARSRTIAVSFLVLLLVLLGAAWKWTDLAEWADPDRISELLEPLRTHWYGLPVVVVVFVVAELFVFPVLVLVFVCGVAFGPVLGPIYALAGSLASALPPFLLGRRLGRARVERMGGPLVRRISASLERRGVVAVFLVRKVPAPYTLVNLVCGASPISLRDFVIGTVLGMGTGVLLLTVVGAQLIELFHDPRPAPLIGAVALLFVPLLLALATQRSINRRIEANGGRDAADSEERAVEPRDGLAAEPREKRAVEPSGDQAFEPRDERDAESVSPRAAEEVDRRAAAPDVSLPGEPRRAAPSPDGILRPGVNCWRIERAERFRAIQDADEYFKLVRSAILAARRSVFILGWDIYAELDLVPGGAETDAPTKLAELLDFAARRTPDLQIHVLIWDYAALYVLERDPLSRIRLGVRVHERVHFRFDDLHPVAGSHHQKVVVVDDRLAFSGGIDLTSHRWDTAEHAVENPLRLTASDEPYTPYHDVQAMVEGPVAAALGELARERWARLGAKDLPPLEPRAESLWPADLPADMLDVDVAIARSDPAFRGREGARECEQLFYDEIAAARRSIYAEQQYFTNEKLGEALAQRLRERDGPEVIVVAPHDCEGWLEQKTMGARRHRVYVNLLDSDLHGRLRLMYPCASRARGVHTFVHSKVLVIDDEHLRIGSANLSSRSMGVDTECDLVATARGEPQLRSAIRRARDRMLGEHFGLTADEFATAALRHGSLRAAIDALAGRDRALAPLQIDREEEPETWDALKFAIDPEEPMELSRTIDRLQPALEVDDARKATRAAFLFACAAGLCLLAFRGASGAASLDADSVQDLVLKVSNDEGAEPWMFAALVLGGLLFVPFELLVLVSVVLLDPGRGTAIAVAAGILCATIGYLVGRALGPKRILPLMAARARTAWKGLSHYGALSVAIVRFVALFSSTSIHVLCGAARVGLRDFTLGSVLGLAPAFLASIALGALLRQAILAPSPLRSLATVAVAIALAGVVLRLRRIVLMGAHGRALRAQRFRARHG